MRPSARNRVDIRTEVGGSCGSGLIRCKLEGDSPVSTEGVSSETSWGVE